MEGTSGDRGVNFRTLADLFAVIEERRVESVYSVTVSSLEVHLQSARVLGPGCTNILDCGIAMCIESKPCIVCIYMILFVQHPIRLAC